jgi:antitoxin component of MazEF toxin-antitoxin module
MNARVAKYGNSLTVRIPATIARELDLKDGDEMRLRRIKGGIALERSAHTRLAARLATVVGSEAEVSTGRAVGREVE